MLILLIKQDIYTWSSDVNLQHFNTLAIEIHITLLTPIYILGIKLCWMLTDEILCKYYDNALKVRINVFGKKVLEDFVLLTAKSV